MKTAEEEKEEEESISTCEETSLPDHEESGNSRASKSPRKMSNALATSTKGK